MRGFQAVIKLSAHFLSQIITNCARFIISSYHVPCEQSCIQNMLNSAMKYCKQFKTLFHQVHSEMQNITS